MPVLSPACRPHDRHVGGAKAVDDGTNGGRRHEGHIDQGDEGARDAWPVNNLQAGKNRRQLSALVVGVLDKPCRKAAPREVTDNYVLGVPDDDDDVVDARLEQRVNDARKKGASAKGQIRLRPPHAGRLARREHDRWDHGLILCDRMETRTRPKRMR